MLIKLSLGVTDRAVDVQAVLRHVYAEDQRKPHRRWGELIQSHPFIVTRIRALADFDAELLALDVEKWLTVD